jgi:hypothetical protein
MFVAVAILCWGQGFLSFCPLPLVDLNFIGFFLCLKLDYKWIRTLIAFQPYNTQNLNRGSDIQIRLHFTG